MADSDKFPEHWLFKHRWSKGKKNKQSSLPNGEKITFLTVGGRTSAVVPSVQKKTGPVAGDVKQEDESSDERQTKRKRTTTKKDTSKTDKIDSRKESKQSVKLEDEDAGEDKDTRQTNRRSTRLRK